MPAELLLRRWLPLVALVGCLVPAWAGGQGELPQALDARSWLARVQQASRVVNYQGSLLVLIGNDIAQSRVVHYASGDHSAESVEWLEGGRQLVLRVNDEILTLQPRLRLATLERRELQGPNGPMPQHVGPQALEQYQFRREAPAQVAGREAEVVLLEPRDALRYALRVWADAASGLLLRADVLGAAAGGTRPVLESTRFGEVAIGVKPQIDQVRAEMRNPRRLEGLRPVRLQQQRTTLEAEGWVLKQPVRGFALVGCVLRSLERVGEPPVLQAVFSDGLSFVSVFAEPYQRMRHVAELRARHGAASTMSLQRGKYWINVVGDVPPETLQLFAEALERRP